MRYLNESLTGEELFKLIFEMSIQNDTSKKSHGKEVYKSIPLKKVTEELDIRLFSPYKRQIEIEEVLWTKMQNNGAIEKVKNKWKFTPLSGMNGFTDCDKFTEQKTQGGVILVHDDPLPILSLESDGLNWHLSLSSSGENCTKEHPMYDNTIENKALAFFGRHPGRYTNRVVKLQPTVIGEAQKVLSLSKATFDNWKQHVILHETTKGNIRYFDDHFVDRGIPQYSRLLQPYDSAWLFVLPPRKIRGTIIYMKTETKGLELPSQVWNVRGFNTLIEVYGNKKFYRINPNVVDTTTLNELRPEEKDQLSIFKDRDIVTKDDENEEKVTLTLIIKHTKKTLINENELAKSPKNPNGLEFSFVDQRYDMNNDSMEKLLKWYFEVIDETFIGKRITPLERWIELDKIDKKRKSMTVKERRNALCVYMEKYATIAPCKKSSDMQVVHNTIFQEVSNDLQEMVGENECSIFEFEFKVKKHLKSRIYTKFMDYAQYLPMLPFDHKKVKVFKEGGLKEQNYCRALWDDSK